MGKRLRNSESEETVKVETIKVLDMSKLLEHAWTRRTTSLSYV